MSSIELLMSNPTTLTDFSLRAGYFFKNNNISTFIQLIAISDPILALESNLGGKTRQEIKSFIETHGLKLGSANNFLEQLGYKKFEAAYHGGSEYYAFKSIVNDADFEKLDKAKYIRRSDVEKIADIYLQRENLIEVSILPLIQSAVPEDVQGLSREFLSAALNSPDFHAQIKQHIDAITRIATTHIAAAKLDKN